MRTISEPTARSERFRLAIAEFIRLRREAKEKIKELDDETALRYDYATWLADAARRVAQIQAVTHVLKATHPDARGSSIHITPDRLPPHQEVGTHQLGEGFVEDVDGNPAALDVFKFLKVEVEGRCLFDWMCSGDPDLARALSADPLQASDWMAALSGLVRADGRPASHSLAKQVYWLAGDDPADDTQYELLEPLFSSSLAHVVYSEIQDARFGDANVAARQAKRNSLPSDGEYREYVGLVARKLGGAKPQNVSQLNSKRRGVNYLLASLPPQVRFGQAVILEGRESAVEVFGRQPAPRQLIRELVDFLRSKPAPTVQTRRRREAIEQALGAELASFAEQVRATHRVGWTRSADCRLARCEQLWLDSGRADPQARGEPDGADDDFFEQEYHHGDWPDQLAARFGNWVNARLHDAGIAEVGDAEQQHWARQAVVEAAWPAPVQRRAAGSDA